MAVIFNEKVDDNDIVDAEYKDTVEEEKEEQTITPQNASSKRPVIIVQRLFPDKEQTKENAEGIQLVLDPEGNLVTDMAAAFIADMAVSRIPDGRSVVLSTRLRNNFIINMGASALTKDSYNEEELIEECKARTLVKIYDYLRFLWSCASVNQNSLHNEVTDMNDKAIEEEPKAE